MPRPTLDPAAVIDAIERLPALKRRRFARLLRRWIAELPPEVPADPTDDDPLAAEMPGPEIEPHPYAG